MIQNLNSKKNSKFLPIITSFLIIFNEMTIHKIDDNVKFIYIDNWLDLNPK